LYSNGTHKITKVSIIHDVSENTDRGVSFMDVYTVVPRPGDINGDGRVDVSDLLLLAMAFGSLSGDPNYNPACDFNADGAVDVSDLLIMASNWGL
jgi:hypothetical protein